MRVYRHDDGLVDASPRELVGGRVRTEHIARERIGRETANLAHLPLSRPADCAVGVRFPHSLEPIHDLNRRLLALLVRPVSDGDSSDFHIETPIGRVLRDADPSVQQSLAHCPFLLLDASFRDPARWRQAESDFDGDDANNPALSDCRALDLARASCLLAWYLVRTDDVAARLILGASAECAALIAKMGLTELQEVAVRLVQRRWFTPRWLDRPDVWQRLISLTQTSPRIAVGDVSIRGLQLFLGELVSSETR